MSNREERRRAGIKTKEKTYTLNKDQIELIRIEASRQATNKAFILMLGIPVMVLHDKYSQLMKREENGKCREERFTDLCLDLFDSYEKDYLSIEDIQKVLKDECGLDILQEK